MRPRSEEKPINVLTEFVTSWIRANSDDAAPFESFETLRDRKVQRKDVERWVLDCNYVYYRVGDMLHERGLVPRDEPSASEFVSSLEASFKSIKDSNPLNLRSKRGEAIVRDFVRDWPPLVEGSRNTAELFDRGLERLAELDPGFVSDNAGALDEVGGELEAERELYQALLDEGSDDPQQRVVEACRALLPLWCLKVVNPLFSLIMWDDEDAVSELADGLAKAFERGGERLFNASGDEVARWRDCVRTSQALYLERIGEDEPDLTSLSIPELAGMLDAVSFVLGQPVRDPRVPAWLAGKAQLVWNVVVCSVFGPGEAVGEASGAGAPTLEVPVEMRPTDRGLFTGEVLLRRWLRDGEVRTVDRLDASQVQSDGLWRVVGSRYDRGAALPGSRYRSQYRNLGVLFYGTRICDQGGRVLEGSGDSRFHLELSLEVEAPGRVRVIARDLGSKNGTCVMRAGGEGPVIYAFCGRRPRTAAEWATDLDVDEASVVCVDRLTLHRGDVIRLAGSCFEVA